MKSYVKWVALGLLAVSASSGAQTATAPPDVPPGHWAYDAVNDLAGKGLVLGYPDGKFLGNRSLTRYEMATIIQRLLRYVDQQADQKIAAAKPGETPAPPPADNGPKVTPADLDEIRRLVDEFKVELTVIGSDLEKIKADIAELQGLKDEVSSINATVSGIGEKVTTIDQDVTDLKKRVAISGYIQARYQSAGGTYTKIANKPEDNFFIRRGRLKFTYTGDKTDFVFQFGGEQQNAFTLRDAIAVWKLTPVLKDRQPQQIWFGQFNTPFGYEIERSDADAYYFERSLAENALFPGERDRGIRAMTNFGPKVWADASILNGGGINAPFTDDNFKDYTARVKAVPVPWFHIGVSGYWGKAALPGVAGTAATPGTLVFNKDTNGDGKIDQTDTPSFAPGASAVAAIPGFSGDRKRYGVDSQINALGGLLEFEGYWGRQPNTFKVPDVKVFGWYGSYVYNVGKSDNLGVRYDTFDPDKNTASNTSSRWTAVWNHYVSKNLKLSGQYEWFPTNPKGTLDTPRWGFQAQTRF